MDPISLIVAALSAGAAAALKDTAGTAVKDAYGGLKSLLMRRLAGQRHADTQVQQIEQRPDADPAPLKQQLEAAGADRDDELLGAARALLKQVDPDGARGGKYNVVVSGGKGVVVGDEPTVTMNFGDGD